MLCKADDVCLQLVHVVKCLFELFVVVVGADTIDVDKIQTCCSIWFWCCCLLSNEFVIMCVVCEWALCVVFVVLVSYVHNRIYLLGGWVVYVYRSWNVW